MKKDKLCEQCMTFWFKFLEHTHKHKFHSECVCQCHQSHQTKKRNNTIQDCMGQIKEI